MKVLLQSFYILSQICHLNSERSLHPAWRLIADNQHSNKGDDDDDDGVGGSGDGDDNIDLLKIRIWYQKHCMMNYKDTLSFTS